MDWRNNPAYLCSTLWCCQHQSKLETCQVRSYNFSRSHPCQKHEPAAYLTTSFSSLQGTGQPGVPMFLSMQSFGRDAAHNRLLAVPAALYAVNNYLKFGMQLYFKPTTAKMLSNMKVVLWKACHFLMIFVSVQQRPWKQQSPCRYWSLLF